MELRQIKYFVKVAQMKSFSAAAKELFISQSTLSQQVQQLENELGEELLIRDSRHVLLSDAGQQLLPHAEKILADAEACMECLKEVDNLFAGTLNIGATYSFWPLIKETTYSFLRQYPGIKLNLFKGSMEELMEKLKRKEVDIALSYKPLQPDESIESKILFKSNLCLIVSSAHPFAKKTVVGQKDLESCPMALPAKGLQARNVLDSILFARQCKLDVRLEINDVSVLLDLIANSDLATFLSQSTISKYPGLNAVRLDLEDTVMTGSYHILKGGHCKKAALAFIQMLVENNKFSTEMENYNI